jgi:hypothetical protein
MKLDLPRARELLAACDLRTLFIEGLGWDHHDARLDIVLAGLSVTLSALAQKRGMVAWQCPTAAGQRIPDYAQRRKIEHQVAKSAHEHLIVFTDSTNDTQIWQWVKREPSKPAACREHTYHLSQPGDALLQKLDAIAFSLDEEEALSLIDVTRRARVGFDVERVTKRFYDQFKKEHATFLKQITGITERADHEWYASLMLNRLMFVYFIQKKGFLDSDRDYLRTRLKLMRAAHGKDKFYSFYRYFLLRLFHEGLGGHKRTPELEKLVGRIPYLNGGLFDVHELERPDRYGKTIQIPDKAFERVFDFFDQYQWHLDERPLRADNEINPDVLGYIFEKYINQKQMGAYYTKEDVTEYISKNTVVPFLFDAVRDKCKVAFDNPGGPTVWDLLMDDPDRYIYSPVRHGMTWDFHSSRPLEAAHELPPEIIAGINPPSLHRVVDDDHVQILQLRNGWNRPAPPEYALPTEIWREVVARRKRYTEVKAKLTAGEVRNINDLITFNLDIRQFAQDVIQNCEGPELLRAFWHSIRKVTILDPTCGSGAFLFAALNILEPLYESCLDLMEALVGDLDRSAEKHRPEKFADFRKVLANVSAHPNRRYFIFKSIILNNLYGVDIMEEAVEICKLRLFLKLAAQVEPDMVRPNLGIEPLPDIDFNIRAGNTLVGFANHDEVKHAAAGRFAFDNSMEKIELKAADLQQVFDAFRARQVEGDGSVPTRDKQELQERLKAMDDELNRYLASVYGVDFSKQDAYSKWMKSHQPFHWFSEFYGIVRDGGFNVIIGNPPYVEYSPATFVYKIPTSYRTLACANLYPCMIERSFQLMARTGRHGMIVPLAGFATKGMVPLIDAFAEWFPATWVSFYHMRPSMLFSGGKVASIPTAVYVVAREGQQARFSTGVQKWNTECRDTLFRLLAFAPIMAARDQQNRHYYPKIALPLENSILTKVLQHESIRQYVAGKSGRNCMYYRSAGGLYWKVFVNFPWPYRTTSNKCAGFIAGRDRDVFVSVLNSSTFWWYYTVTFDTFNVKDYMVFGFRFDYPSSGSTKADLKESCEKLMTDYRAQAKHLKRGDTGSYTIYAKHAKPILDEIDSVLARQYHFTQEELDFVINYDIKYRMGRDEEGVDE